MITTQQVRVCDVCRLVDYDISEKLCGYCPLCDAWICLPDNTQWVRRMKAAVLRKLEFGYRGDPHYGEQGESNAGT